MKNTQVVREHVQIYIDEHGILHNDEQRHMTEESVAFVRKKIEEFLVAGQHPCLVLVDVNGVEIATALPLRGKISEAIKLLKPRKGAIVGVNKMLWVFASFIGNAIGMLNPTQSVKFFTSKDKAIEWLLEK